jgi:hypothetical protein
LAQLDLRFVGFQLHHLVSGNLYHRRYLDDPTHIDLRHWAEFKDATPHTFAGG